MISVIIPTYNKAAFLNLTLASFVYQSIGDFEVVVVDDGSDDTTENVVNSYKSKINLVYIKQSNQGRSIARNKGIVACSGSFLLFNDDDRIVRKDFISEHMIRLTEDSQSINVGGKGRVLTIWLKNELPLRGNDIKTLRSKHGEQWNKIYKSKYCELITAEDVEINVDTAMEKVFLGNEFDSDHIMGIPVDQIPDFRLSWTLGTTANLSVEKSAVVDIGMFDPEFKGWGMEDSDLCYRLHMNGLRMKECPSAYNYHQIHPIGRRWFHTTLSRSRKIDLFRNVDYFHEKTKTPSSFIFHRTFYSNIPTLIGNEILIEFEQALEEKSPPYSEWDNLYDAIMKNRNKGTLKSKLTGWLG